VLATGGVVLDNVNLVSTSFYTQMTKGHLQDGDVIINKDGAQTGKVGLYCVPDGGPACINEHLFLLRGRPDQITQKYLYYTMLSESGQRQIRGEISGSAQPGLKSSFVRKVTASIPIDLNEQSKIAEVLSTVDRAIEQTEALITKQQRIKTGLMQDLLTRGIDEHGNLRSETTHKFKDSPLGRIPVEWDAKTLSEIVDLRVGYAFKSSWFADEGVRLLRGENVGTGSADWRDTQWLPHTMVNRYPEYVLTVGDAVIGMDRTFTKQGVKVTILDDNDVPCLLVQRVGCFEALEIPIDYMKLLVQSPQYQRELLLQQKGMDIPHLSKSEILSPLVPVPTDPREMNAISACVAESSAAMGNASCCLRKLHSIRSGLMQDLLTGDRRVTALLKGQEELVSA
jgi:type I restriction enzyme S subunit